MSLPAGVKATRVFDTYWRFAAERQTAFLRRLSDEEHLTDDPILRRHRFTNAYRAADRVSQYLISRVIYAPAFADIEDVFFRTILFRVFNKVETWEMLEAQFGPISWRTYNYRALDRILSRALSRRQRIYSAAYIMPSRSGSLNSPRKHRNHLRMIEMMMKSRLPDRVADAKSAEDAFHLLRSFPMVGNFLGYQFLTDLGYGPDVGFSEMEFVVAGPGALGGLKKCFADLGHYRTEDAIRFVTESQEAHFAARGIEFQSLWGRPLQLIDCQNLFCEVDKYARVAHPEATPPSGRTKIKQRYRRNAAKLSVWFPPKWKLNGLVDASLGR